MDDPQTPLQSPTTGPDLSHPAVAPLVSMPDWTNRRKVIFYSLKFCAVFSGLIIVISCIALLINVFYAKTTIDPNLTSLLSSIFFSLTFVFSSILGAYVFGVNTDMSNFRNNLMNFFLSKKP